MFINIFQNCSDILEIRDSFIEYFQVPIISLYFNNNSISLRKIATETSHSSGMWIFFLTQFLNFISEEVGLVNKWNVSQGKDCIGWIWNGYNSWSCNIRKMIWWLLLTNSFCVGYYGYMSRYSSISCKTASTSSGVFWNLWRIKGEENILVGKYGYIITTYIDIKINEFIDNN